LTFRRGCVLILFDEHNLPRRIGWPRRRRPDNAGATNAFCDPPADPEMKEIIATPPQVGRISRPFCHIPRLQSPPGLRLPKRRREPGLRRHPAAAPRLQALLQALGRMLSNSANPGYAAIRRLHPGYRRCCRRWKKPSPLTRKI
jgi:hypothetical protein